MKTLQLTTFAALLAALVAASSVVASNTAEDNDISTSSARPVSPVLKDLDDKGRIELFLRKKEIDGFVLSTLMSKKTPEAKELEFYKCAMGDKAKGYLDLYEQACEEVKKK